jgi:cytochrome c5
MRKLFSLVAGAYAVLLIVSFGAAGPEADVLVRERCTVCHGAAGICRNLGKKDPAAWDQTVKRMAGKGARLSEAEQRLVAGFLAAQAPGSRAVCE